MYNLLLFARQAANSTVLPPKTNEQLQLLIAPFFFGVAFNWFLLGILLIQLYWYYLQFPNDPRAVKIMVYFAVIVDLLQTAFTTEIGYTFLINYWGISQIFLDIPKTTVATPITASIVASTAHVFFVWRIFVLGGKNIITGITCVTILLVSLMQMVGTFVGCALFVQDGTSFAALREVQSAFTVWLAGSLAADVLIAVAMLVILRLAQKRTAFKDTSDLITKLSRIAVQTGLVTAICALVQVTLFLRFIDNDLHQVFAFILGKLYTNSLLGNLNSRKRITPHQGSHQEGTTYLWNNSQTGGLSTATAPSIELRSRMRPGHSVPHDERSGTTINVDRQVYTYDDENYKTGLSSITNTHYESA